MDDVGSRFLLRSGGTERLARSDRFGVAGGRSRHRYLAIRVHLLPVRHSFVDHGFVRCGAAKADPFVVGRSTETAEKRPECLRLRGWVPRRRRSGLLVAYRSSVGCCSRARSTYEEETVVLLENGQSRKAPG